MVSTLQVSTHESGNARVEIEEMSTLATQDCDFINITGEPNQGRDARRIHVRRTVMTNYHKRKCRKKNIGPREGHTEVLPVSTQAAPQSTSICRSDASSTDSPSIRGDISLSVASSSFVLKTNSSPTHTRTCPIIVRFLSGQVVKAVRSFRHVSFIHHHVLEAPRYGGKLNDSLVACSEILCSHYNSTVPDLPTLWHRISIAQEHIYGTVGLLTNSVPAPLFFFSVRETCSSGSDPFCCSQCADLDKWQLLSAAQAMTLYILARFKDTTNDEGMFPGMNIALLYTLGVSIPWAVCSLMYESLLPYLACLIAVPLF